MPLYHDQLGRDVNLEATPKRIISVVPSQTELLFYLGLKEGIVGITKFCVHPVNKFKTATKVGGTKQLDIAKIKALKPDLIIANKEENERSQIEELMNICPVWISDVGDLAGALDMIRRVGTLVNKNSEAQALSQLIKQQFDNFAITPLNLKAAYFIWRKPYMVAGKGTFIDSMLQKCGLSNAFDLDRYPEVYAAMIVNAKPDIVFLSSEPYPFRERHITEFNALLPFATIKIVDGELFSWYGSRLLQAPEYFKKLSDELKSV